MPLLMAVFAETDIRANASVAQFTNPPSITQPPGRMDSGLSELAFGFAMCAAALALADLAVSFTCPTSVRWFVLHATANFIVAGLSLPDALTSVRDPRAACEGDYSVVPIYMVAVLHAYHLLVFKNVGRDEWIHHIVFVGIICAAGFVFKPGPLQNLLAFFICGLPGGMDYVMLTLVKLKQLPREQEKEWNARINVWIRSPGLCCTAFVIYTAMLYSSNTPCSSNPLLTLAVCGVIILNGQYYMQVVVGNTFRKVERYSC